MKRNKILLLIFVILLGIAAYFYLSKTNSTVNKSFSDFAIQDTANITQIYIANQYDNQVTLSKNKNGIWLVNHDHKARMDAVDNILTAVKNIVVQDFVPKAAFNNIVKRLASNSIKVEFYFNHSKTPKKVYYVGGATKSQQGTYMLLEENGKKSSEPFVMTLKGFTGFLTPLFFADSNLWRDPHIFQYNPAQIKEVKVEHVENPKESFTLLQSDTGKFTLENSDGQKMKFDTSRVISYLLPYKDIVFFRIDTTLSKAKKDSIIQSKPFHIITVKDNMGKTTFIKTFHMPNYSKKIAPTGKPYPYDINMMFAYITMPDGEKLFTTVQFVIFDNITYDLDYLTGKSNKKPALVGHLKQKNPKAVKKIQIIKK